VNLTASHACANLEKHDQGPVLPATDFPSAQRTSPFSNSSQSSKTFLAFSNIPHSHIPLLLFFHHTQTIGAATAVMATTSALPQGLRTYLTTCSAEHADQIIQTLREHLRQNAGGQAPSAAPSMTAQTGSKVGKKQRNKKAKAKTKQEGATGGPKRPLNSWMAFRSTY